MTHPISVLASAPVAVKPQSAVVAAGGRQQASDPHAFDSAMRRHEAEVSGRPAAAAEASPAPTAEAADEAELSEAVQQEGNQPQDEASAADVAVPQVATAAATVVPSTAPAQGGAPQRVDATEGTARAAIAAAPAQAGNPAPGARTTPDAAARSVPDRGGANASQRLPASAVVAVETRPAAAARAAVPTAPYAPAVSAAQAEPLRLPPALAKAVAAAAAAEGKPETDMRLQAALRALLRSGADAAVPQAQRADAALSPVVMPQAATPPFGVSPVAEPPPLPARSPEMLAQAATRALVDAAADGNWRVSLRLDPPELGRLEVQLSREQGALTASFVAASPAARGALEQAMPMLQSQLNAAGISLGETSVSQHGAGRHAPGNSASGDAGSGDGTLAGEGVPLDPVTAAVRRQEGLFEGWA